MKKNVRFGKVKEIERSITRLFSVYLGEITELGSSPRYQWRLQTFTKRHSYTSPSNAAGREPIKSLEFTVNRT